MTYHWGIGHLMIFHENLGLGFVVKERETPLSLLKFYISDKRPIFSIYPVEILVVMHFNGFL